jgi:hypothetical protein
VSLFGKSNAVMPVKVAYLFGAGATHAEIQKVDPNDGNFLSKEGLLIGNVSKRVMKIAKEDAQFIKGVEEVTYREGPINIELLISLFETNRVPDSALKVAHLKNLVKSDITGIIRKRKTGFYLHKALFEFHKVVTKEQVLGVISLNYDTILDDSFFDIYKQKPDYCHTALSQNKSKLFPILKLHGSFNWTKIDTYGKKKEIEIIPLGISKNYLAPPYNFIWGRAYEILAQCDVLRVIGCSLSQNDLGLVDLLFKAHMARKKFFTIQIIDLPDTGKTIKNSYGFFRGIQSMEEIERPMIPLDDIERDGANPFMIWLRAKARKMISDRQLARTKFLRKVCNS